MYMYYPNSESKGTDQVSDYCSADLHLCFGIYADCWFSGVSAHYEILFI